VEKLKLLMKDILETIKIEKMVFFHIVKNVEVKIKKLCQKHLYKSGVISIYIVKGYSKISEFWSKTLV